MSLVGALSTQSSFYYGWLITPTNRYIDFNDGTVKTVQLKVGSYTSAGLAAEIAKQLNGASSIDFTVTFNRTTRKFTIAGASTFSLLFATGVNTLQSPASLLGYTITDKTAASSYLAEGISGSKYQTQFKLQSYKDTSTNRKAVEGVVNKSTSGTVEVVKFGNERFMEFEALFITNVQQDVGSIIRNNPTGLEEVITMLEWATEKRPIEFMKDENNPNEFQSFILESTESDQNGLGFDLVEMYDRGIAYYWRTGKLTFRLIEE